MKKLLLLAAVAMPLASLPAHAEWRGEHPSVGYAHSGYEHSAPVVVVEHPFKPRCFDRKHHHFDECEYRRWDERR